MRSGMSVLSEEAVMPRWTLPDRLTTAGRPTDTTGWPRRGLRRPAMTCAAFGQDRVNVATTDIWRCRQPRQHRGPRRDDDGDHPLEGRDPWQCADPSRAAAGGNNDCDRFDVDGCASCRGRDLGDGLFAHGGYTARHGESVFRFRQLHDARLWRHHSGGALALARPTDRDEWRAVVRMVDGGHLPRLAGVARARR